MALANLRSRARWLPTAGIAVPFLLAVVAQALGPRPGPMAAAPARPALAFDQYLVDLGPVAPSEEVFAHFSFTNRGHEPVTVLKLVPSCGCLQPQMEKWTYQHGQTGHFVVRVQTANENPGPKEYRITVKYSDPVPRDVDVVFRVVLPDNQVLVRPRALAIYQFSDEPTVREIEVIDRRRGHLNITSVECSRDIASVELEEGDVDEAGNWRGRLKVTVPGNLPAGRTDAVVRIFTDDPAYRTLRVPLIVEGASPGKFVDPNVRHASGTR
jgi:hypothetical protein